MFWIASVSIIFDVWIFIQALDIRLVKINFPECGLAKVFLKIEMRLSFNENDACFVSTLLRRVLPK